LCRWFDSAPGHQRNQAKSPATSWAFCFFRHFSVTPMEKRWKTTGINALMRIMSPAPHRHGRHAGAIRNFIHLNHRLGVPSAAHESGIYRSRQSFRGICRQSARASWPNSSRALKRPDYSRMPLHSRSRSPTAPASASFISRMVSADAQSGARRHHYAGKKCLFETAPWVRPTDTLRARPSRRTLAIPSIRPGIDA